MDLKELKELIELVSANGFTEFELEREGFRLRICKSPNQASAIAPPVPVFAPPAPHAPVEMPAPVTQREIAPAAASSATSAQAAVAVSEAELHVIKSPIVGTFYRASSPTSEPFVRVGSSVEPDTVVCIIEAMKLMNEIQAEVTGEVAKIYVENGQPVEYGQPLFGIKT
ncbi:MAG TPA: acetyl-CoA carboxylase biotin carboxyl carrier protein [Blastocatellia bacterium]|nr:acetyl-CoA carboxylase biotin carboxyl carrier protein [Blastocatellia bacterium]